MTSLLPPNATDHERALEALVARIAEVPVPLRSLWSPDDCPVELLPWLAWALSVDGWENGWTEQQKRESIKASYYVHSRKGTAAAMRVALNALGLGLQVVEWFEDTPQGAPYTFRVKLTIDQKGISQADLLRAHEVVGTAKNLRSHLAGVELTLISKSQPAPCIAAATVSGHVITVLPGT